MGNEILIIGLCVLAVLNISLIIAHRFMRKRLILLNDNIANISARLDIINDNSNNLTFENKNIKDDLDYITVMTQYNLSVTRLQLMSYQNYAIQEDQFEEAAKIAKSISHIEQLLDDY